MRDFSYWLKLSIYVLSGEIITQSILNNLSFSDEKGYEKALKEARKFRIIEENVFDTIENNSFIKEDDKPWDLKTGWKSREAYRQMLGMTAAQVNQNFKSVEVNKNLIKR